MSGRLGPQLSAEMSGRLRPQLSVASASFPPRLLQLENARLAGQPVRAGP